MSDDVIKNPNRSFQKPQVPYEPEYMRHGVVVLEVPVSQAATKVASPTLGLTAASMEIDGEGLNDNVAIFPRNSGHIIDNNEFVNIGFSQVPRTPEPIVQPVESPTETTAPQIGEYILMVMGKLITSGSIEKIQSKVKNIMYGDDAAFSDTEVSIDDIVVLKRVNIKVGIFIDG